MIYSITSNDPNNYGTVKCDINVPWRCEQVKYYVDSINTFANFLITTKEDYIKINEDIYYFEDRCSYEIEELASYLNKILNTTNFTEPSSCHVVTVNLTTTNLLQFNGSKDFQITDASHRTQMLLGMFNTTLPIKSIDKVVTLKTVPQTCYGNIMYLMSLHGQTISSHLDDHEYTPSVVYRLNTFMKSGLPIIINKKQDKIQINPSAISKMEMQLVDHKYQPVILKSPLTVSIKIRPVKSYSLEPIGI